MRQKKKQLTGEALELIAARFRVLSEPTRLKILHTLGEGERSVGELVEAIGGSQANVSKHLAILLDAGLVSRRRDGVTIYYRVADETVFELCETVCSSLGQRLAAQQSLMSGFSIK
ncbi:MAG TPA: metalloregulator ArsR/SmtB family transcription factor [Blastocatellia bacterium]|nr:metalloregulator ArsR/SmtB family transcription factor [Blastocatellia bacterium]